MNRDYDLEAANLPKRDFDLRMHDFMWRTFLPMMVGGNALELGCFHGAWTARLFKEFVDVTAVDASADCIAAAKARWPLVEFIHSTFEDVDLGGRKFENVFLLHTLEHVDQPVELLRKVRELIAPGGRLFLAVPNGFAASRRLAVRMSIIRWPEEVTSAESAHGHKRTYILDSLCNDVMAAGLEIESRGGIFFKPLSGEQFDKALRFGVVNDAYMEACYELGKKLDFQEMCNSVYVVAGAS